LSLASLCKIAFTAKIAQHETQTKKMGLDTLFNQQPKHKTFPGIGQYFEKKTAASVSQLSHLVLDKINPLALRFLTNQRTA